MHLIARKKELKAQKVTLLEEAQAALDAATKAQRDLTEAERARDDEIQAAVREINHELAGIDRVLEADRDAPGPTEAALPGRVGAARFADLFPGRASAEGWTSFDQYLGVIHSGVYHPGLRAATMTTGVGSDGGYLVPSAFLAALLDRALEDEIVRPRATVYPMNDAPSMRVPILNGFDTSTGKPYGFSGQWLAEDAEASTERGKVVQLELHARSLACYTEASNELVRDGFSFEQQLGTALTRAIAWHLDGAFLTGTGAGQPQGMYESPSRIVVAKEGSQTAATITYTNLVKMLARLHPACFKNAVWVANPTTIPQLAQLTIAVGSGGAHIPVMTESDGRFVVLTRPVIFTEKVPALGTQGDIALVDFSQYVIALRAQATLDKSAHVGWTRRATGYRIVLRADGQCGWPSVTTPKHGDTQSCCVLLATRS